MRQKLSKSVIDRMVSKDRDTIHWDRDLKGFGVKVTPAGRKVFIVQHRPKVLGGLPKNTPSENSVTLPSSKLVNAHKPFYLKALGGSISVR
jgi:hypothetical protein